jgi:hypothetical protein
MRKKVLITLLLCVAWAWDADAQNTIESIRKAYQDVHEQIARMTPDEEGMWQMPPQYFDLQVVQNLPATGPHRENIRFFYGELEPENEEEEEMYNPYPPHYLHFATAKYNFAVREFYEEYLYDNKGNIMFIYVITPDVVIDGNMDYYELRMWFDGKRLLRFTAKKFERPLDFDNPDIASLRKGTFNEEYSGTSIPEKYQREATRCQQRAQRFLTMFKGIDDNTYL